MGFPIIYLSVANLTKKKDISNIKACKYEKKMKNSPLCNNEFEID